MGRGRGSVIHYTVPWGCCFSCSSCHIQQEPQHWCVSLKDDYRIDKNLLERLISIGLPSAMEQFLLRLGQVFFSRAVAGLGTAVYAAHQTAINISSLTFTPGQAFGMAATTMVGQSLGAKHPDVAEKSRPCR